LKEIILLLVDPPDKVAGNAGVECPVASLANMWIEYDISAGSLDSGLRRNDRVYSVDDSITRS
ncbi:MAG: hypothetical protein Q8R28_08290, partial [Dehalococcoidia bacterium]|nr:hypothetical protein [Dehalococcoidia bacterium]